MRAPRINSLTVLRNIKYILLIAVVFPIVTNVNAAVSGLDFYKVPVNLMCKLFDAFVTVAAALGGLILVVAGVTWMVSYDNPQKRQTAKSVAIHTVIGLIIVSLAATIIGSVTIPLPNNTNTASTAFKTICAAVA